MDVTTGRWSNTKRVLKELHALLHCGVCKKTLTDPLCLGRCEHYFCWSCAEVSLGKACPLCGVPSHVKDAQPNRQLGAATSLCGQLMVILGLNDQSGQQPKTDPIPESALLSSEASNQTKIGQEKKAISTEAKKNDYASVDIRPRVAPVRNRAGNLKFTSSKPWNEKAGVHEENKNGDACGRTDKRESEEDTSLSENLLESDRQSSSAKSESGSGKDIEGKSRARPQKRMRLQTRSDVTMERSVKERKKRLSLETPRRREVDAKVNDSIDDEMREDGGQREYKATEVDTRGRKRRRVFQGDTVATVSSGRKREDCSIVKSENNVGIGDGDNQNGPQTASEEKKESGSASTTRRRNVHMSNDLKNKSGRSNEHVDLFQKPKAQDELASPDVGLKADSTSTSSSDHLLSDLFSTPKSQLSGRTNSRSQKSSRSPATPQLRGHSVITPKSALVTPKTESRSLITPKSAIVTPKPESRSLITPKSALVAPKPESRSLITPKSALVTPKPESRSLITPKSALVTPKTKRSPVTPKSSRGSSQKRNEKGETRLHIECIKGDLDAVRSLLEDGENPNIRDFANWTPLHEACNHGYAKIAELLLNYGAMINVPGGENATPLHDAVQNYRLECVRLLVSRGASKTLRDLHGKTPVDLALTCDMKEALNVPVTIIDSLIPSSQSVGTSSPTFSQSVTLLATGLDATSKSSLVDCAKKLNWKVKTDFSPEVTHLVTSVNKEGVCIRTIKYLQAVLTGKWIVSFEWICACEKSSTLVAEEPYEISGSTHNPKSFAPRKGRQCVAQQLPLLFNGCHFFFHGDFHHPSPSKDDLSKLVKLGSGIVLTREPKQETIDQSDFIVPYHADPLASLANCGYFIVAENSDFTMIGSRMCRVSPSWILSSIAEFRLVEYNSSKP